ncbi:MAG TPA: hypothetical protein VLE95_07140, partial [Chlamydiales bacterium]|nr:hypothetical protein [Chlamydiales bacterium]
NLGAISTKVYCPQILDRKAAQKNRKIDRNEVCRQSLRSFIHCERTLRHRLRDASISKPMILGEGTLPPAFDEKALRQSLAKRHYALPLGERGDTPKWRWRDTFRTFDWGKLAVFWTMIDLTISKRSHNDVVLFL